MPFIIPGGTTSGTGTTGYPVTGLESLVLDGLSLHDGTTFGLVSLTMPPPRERQDWIGAADSEAQLLFRKPLHENRKITARVWVMPQSSMDAAHDKLALVIDKLAKASKYENGIPLTWTPASGTRTVTFDVLSGEITDLPIDWENGWLVASPEFTVELTAKPYWYGSEVLTATASSSSPFVTLEIPNVPGDVPALGRLIVTDTASQPRRHVEWGLEGPLTYGAGTYAAGTSLLLDSDSLVTSGFAGAQSTVAGSYDPNGTGSNAIFATVYGQATALCGTGDQLHTGSFRVKARVAAGTNSVYFRLSWRVGDGPMTSNAWALAPVSGATTTYYELDLGSSTVPQVAAGTQRWTGQIETYSPNGLAASAVLDYLVLVPMTDGYGKARASYTYSAGVITGQDSFGTSGAALDTRTATAGGTWATSGETTDWLNVSYFAGAAIRRSVVTDTTTGRFGVLGSAAYTDVQVDAQFSNTSAAASNASTQSLIARWVDASNHLRLVVTEQFPSATLRLEQVVSGTVTVLGSTTWARTFNGLWNPRLIAFASGRVVCQIANSAGTVLGTIDAASTALATGGALASGKSGLRDFGSTSDINHNRYITNFSVSIPATEPVAVYGGRNMQVRYDDTIRQDSTGTYTGKPQSYRGGRFMLPVGTSRVLVKARRNDVEAAADDTVTDATQIQVAYTPRGLAVPRA